MSRENLKKYISTTLPTMEIGPLQSPFLKKEGIDLPIYNLSEVKLSPDIGIILTMSGENNRNQVKSELLKLEFSNIFQLLYVD